MRRPAGRDELEEVRPVVDVRRRDGDATDGRVAATAVAELGSEADVGAVVIDDGSRVAGEDFGPGRVGVPGLAVADRSAELGWTA